MHSPRSFSFDKLKNKVTHRRHSNDSSIMELVNSHSDRRHSSDTSSSLHHKVEFLKALSPPKESSRLRATSFSLVSPDRDTKDTSQNSNSHGNSGTGIHSRSRSRSRSHSVTRGTTLSPSNLFKPKTKDLIKQETAHIISKKLVSMLRELGLQNPIPLKTSTQGSVSKTIKVYVANSNDCIYLPPASSASFTYEDVENGGAILTDEVAEPGVDSDTQSNTSQSTDHSTSQSTDPRTSHSSSITHLEDPIANSLYQRMRSFHSPNYLCTKIDSELPIPHTFAVIIELSKDLSTVKDLTFKFQSMTQILWPMGDPYKDPYNRATAKEKFKIGTMQWRTTLNDADYFISNSNSNEVKSRDVHPEDLAKRTRSYQLVDPKKDANSGENATNVEDLQSLSSSSTSINTFPTTSSSHIHQNTEHKAGLYVFLLPVLLPEHIPASIISINGSLIHTLSVNFNKTSEKLNRKLKVSASYNVPMVRTPPNFANSIADKPIYVNRVWNDAVHYMITFPRKYVSLGSEHVINVKLVPLVKNVVVKRIKFNVLERITYVSQNLLREYDYDSEDPYNMHPRVKENKVRERVVALCELKTKSKQSSSTLGDPYKEEVIKCPDNNLLFSCYEPESNLNPRKSSKSQKDKDKTMIASPLDINIALPFLTTKSDKTLMTSSANTSPTEEEGSFSEQTRTRKQSTSKAPSRPRQASVDASNGPTSPVIGALETNVANVDEIGLHAEASKRNIRSNSKSAKPDILKSNLRAPTTSNYLSDDMSSKHMPPENIKNGYTLTTRALYPDSNFRHIQISHRLQVCFRISKPDPKDDYKMHHYEVVVDTPLILLSSKCNEGSVQLPQYDELDAITTDLGVVDDQSPSSRNGTNYSNNGVSIKPWVQNDDDEGVNSFGDQLPSFEEATSTPNSPKVRSISLSEEDPLSGIPSIPIVLPNEPAPAYEYEEKSHQTEESQTPSLDSVNIDEIVSEDLTNTNTNSSTPSALSSASTSLYSVGQLPQHRKSSIKESLSLQFARQPSVSKDQNNTNLNLNAQSSLPSGSAANDTASSASSSLDGASLGSAGSSSSAASLMGGGTTDNGGIRGDEAGEEDNGRNASNAGPPGGNGVGVTPPSSTVPDRSSLSSEAIEESETGEEIDHDDDDVADDNSSAISPKKVVLPNEGVEQSDASSITPYRNYSQYEEAIDNDNDEDGSVEDDIEDNETQHLDDSEEDSDFDHENGSGSGSGSDDDDLSSLELQETTFDQRLPLLRHISTDTIRTQPSNNKLPPHVFGLNRTISSNNSARYGGGGNFAASSLPTPQATNVTVHSYFSPMASSSSAPPVNRNARKE